MCVHGVSLTGPNEIEAASFVPLKAQLYAPEKEGLITDLTDYTMVSTLLRFTALSPGPPAWEPGASPSSWAGGWGQSC